MLISSFRPTESGNPEPTGPLSSKKKDKTSCFVCGRVRTWVVLFGLQFFFFLKGEERKWSHPWRGKVKFFVSFRNSKACRLPRVGAALRAWWEYTPYPPRFSFGFEMRFGVCFPGSLAVLSPGSWRAGALFLLLLLLPGHRDEVLPSHPSCYHVCIFFWGGGGLCYCSPSSLAAGAGAAL